MQYVKMMGWGGEGGLWGSDVQIITVLTFGKVLPVKFPDSTNTVGKLGVG